MLLLLSLSSAMMAQQLAFPGAQGFGRFAVGGRNGSVYHVTNLNDSGTGSLRDAVSQPNRIVVFDVAGVIKINSRIVFAKNLYVAGQTAPGEGVTVYGDGVSFSGASNSIIRYLRVRMGRGGTSGKDCAGIANGTNIIVDHCSFAWGQDETFSINSDGKGDLGDITLSNCIVGQGLLDHSAGGLMQADNITLYRNFYCDNSTRNNKVKGKNQYVNNIVYNWQNGCYIMGGDSEGESFCNIENNLFINGPAKGGDAFGGGNANFHFYANDNWQDNNLDGTLNPYLMTSTGGGDKVATPFAYPELEKWDGNTLITNSLPMVGASLPYRDYTDYYMIDEVMSFGKRGALISNEASLKYGTPDTWTVWKGNTRIDTDNDGMPDAWEKANGTDPNKNDAMTKAANGYANIENYINSITVDDRDYFLRTPLCLELKHSTSTTLEIEWCDYTYGEEGFALEIKGGSYGGTFTEVMRTAAGATAATVSGLTPGTTYTVRLRAFASSPVEGSFSEYTPEVVMKTRPEEVEMIDCETFIGDDKGNWLIADPTDKTYTLTGDNYFDAIVVRTDANITIGGTGIIMGEGSVNKTRSGNLTVEGQHTYTGQTVLHDGTFTFNTLKNGGEMSAIGASQEFAQNWIWDGGTWNYTGGSTTTNRSAKIYRETAFNIANASAVVTMNGGLEGSDNFVLDGKGQLKVASTKFFELFTGDVILRGGNMYLSTTDITTKGIGSAKRLVMAGGKLSTKGETSGYETYAFPIYVEDGTTSIFAPNRNCYINSTVTGTGTLQFDIPYLREYILGNYSGFKGRIIANGVGTDKNGSLFLINKGNPQLDKVPVELKGNARLCAWDTNPSLAIGGLSGVSGTYLMGSSKNTNGFKCTWTVGGANTNETFAGIINDWSCSGSGYTGTVSIVKTGSGDWRLTGNNTYKGTTTVNGGRLVVNGTNSGTGAVTVANNGTLAGTGTVSGKVTVNGVIHAGDTLVNGKGLTLASTLTLGNNSVMNIPLAATTCNKLTFKGKVTIGTGVTLTFNNGDDGMSGTPVKGKEYQIFSLASGVTIDGTFANIATDVLGTGQTWDTTDLYTKGVLRVAEDASAVKGVTTSAADSDVYYNLMGHRTQKNAVKGIYVRNGKKILKY
ncbi:MAG: autotransporter-associated beta strand repeat-containing protein [Bacteroidaceae bacterium]|nr:autotransporter-associated beta strand repeat-containing protein [Bacteroidaceae bacterium]